MNESQLYRGSCLDILPTLPNDSVQLIVTSPPYNVGWKYADDGSADSLPLAEYEALLYGAFAGCYRVLRPGGVLALNVPPSIHLSDEERAYPIGAKCQVHLLDAGWKLREPLVWAKSYSKADDLEPVPLANGTAWGGGRNLYLRPTHELVILASKGQYDMPGNSPKFTIPGYIDVLKDVWWLPPGKTTKGQPLAFPAELVSRLVQLFSAPGDLVLDPFAGTGSVGRVARLHGREAWLIEREPSYWPRLESTIGQQVMLAGVR